MDKPGHQTSEFKLIALLIGILLIVVGICIYRYQKEAVAGAEQGAGIAAAGYAISRGFAKKGGQGNVFPSSASLAKSCADKEARARNRPTPASTAGAAARPKQPAS